MFKKNMMVIAAVIATVLSLGIILLFTKTKKWVKKSLKEGTIDNTLLKIGIEELRKELKKELKNIDSGAVHTIISKIEGIVYEKFKNVPVVKSKLEKAFAEANKYAVQILGSVEVKATKTIDTILDGIVNWYNSKY